MSNNKRSPISRHGTPALFLLVVCSVSLSSLSAGAAEPYRGQPYHDSVYHGGPQAILGRAMCAYYDPGGEDVAYHDSDTANKDSGTLNPADGSYLNEFRMHEGVDISYTKYRNDIDDNPYEVLHPPKDLLYVGWTDPWEWFNRTVKRQRGKTLLRRPPLHIQKWRSDFSGSGRRKGWWRDQNRLDL